ncbi:MAG: hypothetical protein H6537_03490 [Bacteroidales bacterium]|nr:hypothetical protein [Bacteroidales bacterium]HPD94402.1 hypothetical protein [Tenuifilaceae bacterium]HRX30785.1 hypothetical protein [Tenuifilaceae bacterium]
MNVEVKTTAGQAMGIIGIVLAIISLILAFIPCIGVVALLPGGLSLIFSIISIVQATNGYGSKGLGIGALIVSLISVILAALWLMVFSGTLVFADKIIKNADKIETFGDEFGKAMEEEFSDGKGNVHIDISTDSLENTLRALEDSVDGTNGKLTDKEKIQKAARATAKALKKSAKVVVETDSVKIKIEANEN